MKATDPPRGGPLSAATATGTRWRDRTWTGTGHRRLLVAAAVAAALAPWVAAAPVAAQEVREDTAGTSVVGLRETALRLRRSGLEHRDPRALVAAAELLIVEGAPTGVRRRDPGTEGGREADLPADDADLSPDRLLRRAVELAVEREDRPAASRAIALAADPTLGLGDEALAEELRSRAAALGSPRGAVGGAIRREGWLAEGQSAEYAIVFEGGNVPNGIVVSASERYADLDCYLYAGEEEVARDEGYASDCFLAWKQGDARELRLRVTNSGAPTFFVLISN